MNNISQKQGYLFHIIGKSFGLCFLVDTGAKVSVICTYQIDHKCPQQISTYNHSMLVFQSVHIHNTFLQLKIACQELEHTLQEGVIQPSCSSWS